MVPSTLQFFFLLSGLYTWNKGDNHVDIETELKIISDCAPPGEEARGGKISKIDFQRFSIHSFKTMKSNDQIKVIQKFQQYSDEFCMLCKILRLLVKLVNLF